MSSELFRVLSNYFYHLFMVRTQPTLGEMTSFCYNIINQKITVSFGFMGGGYSNTGSHLHLEKLRVTFVQLDNKITVSYGNWSYIAGFTKPTTGLYPEWDDSSPKPYPLSERSILTFRHRASCILGQAFHYSPGNAFYIFSQQIYFIIWYLLDRASLI